MFTKLALNGLYFLQLDRLCTPLTAGVGNVWMLHRVTNTRPGTFSPNQHLRVSPEFLDAAILKCKSMGVRFVTLDELVERLGQGEANLPSVPICSITLDDGYLDNLENAVPIFRRHNVPYTIFIASGLVDATHQLWWEDLEQVVANNRKVTVPLVDGVQTFETADLAQKNECFDELLKILSQDLTEDQQREIVDLLSKRHRHNGIAYVKRELMNWQQLSELNKDPLCPLGAHTVGHYAVARLSIERATYEITASRDRLKEMTGAEAQYFAYPYGYAGAAKERDFDLVQSLGFRAAFTTRYGVVKDQGKSSLFSLPRISINGYYQSERYLRPLMSGLPVTFKRLGNREKFA